jgi:hypothetical protein
MSTCGQAVGSIQSSEPKENLSRGKKRRLIEALVAALADETTSFQ